MYKLKNNQPAFEIVDGPLAGRRFEHGKQYVKAPAGYRRRFKRIKALLAKKAVEKPAGGEAGKKK